MYKYYQFLIKFSRNFTDRRQGYFQNRNKAEKLLIFIFLLNVRKEILLDNCSSDKIIIIIIVQMKIIIIDQIEIIIIDQMEIIIIDPINITIIDQMEIIIIDPTRH